MECNVNNLDWLAIVDERSQIPNRHCRKKEELNMKRTMKGTLFALFCSIALIFPAAVQAADVNIGMIMPTTGRVAFVGIDSLHGAEIAAKEINDNGGLLVAGKRYTVKIRHYNDEASAAKAVAGLQRLKDRYDIPAALCGLSGPTMAMLERNERLGVMLFGFFKHPGATSMGNKLVIRHQKTAETDARLFGGDIYKAISPKTYAMASDSSDYGKAMVKGYREVFKKLGMKEVANEWFDQRTQTDFRGQLTKIRAAKPDIILLTAHDEASAGFVKQAHELGITTPFGLSPGFQSEGLRITGPKLVEGYFKYIEFTSKTPWPKANTRYRKELFPAMGYKEKLAPFGISMYASVHIITRAMQEAGTTTDVYKIRAAVPKVVPLPEKYNTTGASKVHPNGDCDVVGELGVFRNGILMPVNK